MITVFTSEDYKMELSSICYSLSTKDLQLQKIEMKLKKQITYKFEMKDLSDAQIILRWDISKRHVESKVYFEECAKKVWYK